MSRKVLGITLAIIGALAMVINISFFKEKDWYDTIRWISIAFFFIGSTIIPNYSKPKDSN